MATIDESVVRISPDLKGFTGKLRAGLKAATAGVNPSVKVGLKLDARGFAAQVRAAAAKAATSTKIKVGVDCRGLAAALRDCGRKAAGSVVVKVRVAADCKFLTRSVRDCLRAAGLDLVSTEARKAAQAVRAEARQAQREAERSAERITRQADKARRARLGALSQGLGNLGENASFIDLGRKGVRPVNALLAAAIAASPALLAMASSAGLASTSVVALGAAAVGAVSTVGVLAFAFNGLGEALKLEQQAADGSEAATDKLHERLAAMAPAARRLYGELLAVRTEMRGFTQVAAQATLPGFTAFLEAVRAGGVSTVDVFKAGMADLGGIISLSVARLGEFAGSEFFRGHLARITNENTEAFGRLAEAALMLLRPVTRLVSAAAPQLTRFAGYLQALATRFAAWISGFTDADLAGFFRRAGDEMAVWGRIAGNLLGILRGLFLGSLPAGERLAERFAAWTGRINEFVNSAEGLRRVREFFDFFGRVQWDNIATGLYAIAAGLIAVKGAMLAGGLVQGLISLAAGNWIGLALGAIGAAVLGIGAAAAYAYVQYEPFRRAVNEGLAVAVRSFQLFKDAVMPGVTDALRELSQVYAENRGELRALLQAAAALAVVLAKVGGRQMADSMRIAAVTISGTVDVVALMARTFAAAALAAASAARVMVLAFHLAGSRIAETIAFLASKLALVAAATGQHGLAQALGEVARELPRKFAEGTAAALRELDTLATGAAAVLRQMQNDAAGPGGPGARATFARVLPRKEDLAAARAELDAALRAQANAARGVGEAVAAANRSLQDARTAARDAGWAVSDAERAIAEGQREAREAQRALTEARAEAREELRRLRVEARGLAADEEEARIRLAVSREVAKSFEYSSSVDPLFKRKIRNDVAQAEQDLVETLDNGRKVRRELADAERKGIDGSDRVITARKRIRDITAQNTQRERDLTRAQENARRAADDLRLATDRAARSRSEATAAYARESRAVEEARKKYGDLKAQIDAVPKAKTTTITAVAKVSGAITGKGVLEHVKRQAVTVSIQDRSRRATGGPIYGPGTKTSDSVPIMASAGEFMQPAKAVDYYGVGVMEAIRRRQVPKAALRGMASGGLVDLKPHYKLGLSVLAAQDQAATYAEMAANKVDPRVVVHRPVRTFIVPASAFTTTPGRVAVPPGGGFGRWPASPAAQRGDSGVWRSILALVRANRIPYQFGNAYRHRDPLWHGSGRAVDFTGYNQDRLAQFFMSIRPRVLELIHTTRRGGYYISRGVRQASMGVQDELHRNHLHVAMARGGLVGRDGRAVPARRFDSGGLLMPGATLAVNRTGRPETVRTSAQEAALRGPVRIDKRDLKLLAAYLAQASEKAIDLDGRRVAEAVNRYNYLPAGV